MAITTQQSNKKPATKDNLVKLEKKLEKKLASKKDLTEMEGRMDKKFATKKDLDKFAVRAFNTFATKEDIKESERRITEKFDEKFDKILTAVDGVTNQYQAFDIGFTMNQGAHDRFEEELLKQKKELELLKRD